MSDFYAIMGTTSTTASQMANYFTAKGGKYPYSDNKDAPTIKDFCQIYIDECKVEGVKAEVAFAQAMMETGFLRFGGDVKKSSIILPVLEQLEMELQVMDLNLFGLEFERRYSI